jgi:hypothetical protein
MGTINPMTPATTPSERVRFTKIRRTRRQRYSAASAGNVVSGANIGAAVRVGKSVTIRSSLPLGRGGATQFGIAVRYRGGAPLPQGESRGEETRQRMKSPNSSSYL